VVDTRRVDGKVFQIVGPETAKLRVFHVLVTCPDSFLNFDVSESFISCNCSRYGQSKMCSVRH